MTNEPTELSPEQWHRYFAIECNNRAWSLATQTSRTSDEVAAMLDAAHAASFHWQVVGTELNHLRAKLLLAEAHALAGFGQSAFTIAEDVRSSFLGRESDAWEVALVYAIHAHAAAVAGMPQAHRASHAAAADALATIADDENRRIVLLTFAHVPAPEE